MEHGAGGKKRMDQRANWTYRQKDPDKKKSAKYNESPIGISEINNNSESDNGMRTSSSMGIGILDPIKISYGIPHKGVDHYHQPQYVSKKENVMSLGQ